MLHKGFTAGVLLTLILAGCTAENSAARRKIDFPNEVPGVITAVTFNIRYGTAADGPNHWDNRRKLVFDLLAEQAADVICMQESLSFQTQQIHQALPQYGVVAVGRDDGKQQGESCPIFYRRSRFTLSDSATFWFSNTPWIPGSKHWGNTLPRICTWVRLTEKTSGKTFYVFNLHLDHQSEVSRQQSVELLAKQIASRPHADPFIVMGDFNMGLSDPAMTDLTQSGTFVPGLRMADTWQALHPNETPPGTYHGFDGTASGPKIDHILIGHGTEIIEVAIDARSFSGRWPSDHFLVMARLKLFE
jgi:endonuclease/exonuclease/phosphatase family metal-dependent hydrolase